VTAGSARPALVVARVRSRQLTVRGVACLFARQGAATRCSRDRRCVGYARVSLARETRLLSDRARLLAAGVQLVGPERTAAPPSRRSQRGASPARGPTLFAMASGTEQDACPDDRVADELQARGQRRTAVMSVFAAGALVVLKLGTGLVVGSLGLVSAGTRATRDRSSCTSTPAPAPRASPAVRPRRTRPKRPSASPTSASLICALIGSWVA
jgi:hypothetical protein